MIVKITNFDENAEIPYVDYEVCCRIKWIF